MPKKKTERLTNIEYASVIAEYITERRIRKQDVMFIVGALADHFMPAKDKRNFERRLAKEEASLPKKEVSDAKI
jgi:hypothetical protein